MKPALDPVFGPLIAHANLNLLTLGLAPLDIENLGATAPVAPAITDEDRRDPSADCKRCGGRSYIVIQYEGTASPYNVAAIPCPECMDNGNESL